MTVGTFFWNIKGYGIPKYNGDGATTSTGFPSIRLPLHQLLAFFLSIIMGDGDMSCCTAGCSEISAPEGQVDEEIGKWLVRDAKRGTFLADVNDIVYDHASVYFDFLVFLKEFFIHLLHPLFIWVDPIMHSFKVTNPTIVFLVHLNGPMVILLIVASYKSGPGTNVERTEWILPLLCYVLHRLSVSLKYACLHPAEYKKLRQCTDTVKMSRYQYQLQILTGWLGDRSDVSKHFCRL